MSADVVLSTLGTVIAFFLFASQAPMIRAMLREGDASKYPYAPTFLLLLNCVMWTGYAVTVQRRVDTFVVNFVGVLFCVVYSGAFMRVSPPAMRRRIGWGVVGACGGGILFFLALFGTDNAVPVPERAKIAAILAIVFNVGIFVSPVRALMEALRQLDTQRVSVLLTIASLAAAADWGAFGLVVEDYFVFTPNAIGFVLSLAQVAVLGYIRHQQRRLGRATLKRAAALELPSPATSTSPYATPALPPSIDTSGASLSIRQPSTELGNGVGGEEGDHGGDGLHPPTPAVIVRISSLAERRRGGTTSGGGGRDDVGDDVAMLRRASHDVVDMGTLADLHSHDDAGGVSSGTGVITSKLSGRVPPSPLATGRSVGAMRRDRGMSTSSTGVAGAAATLRPQVPSVLHLPRSPEVVAVGGTMIGGDGGHAVPAMTTTS